MIDLLEIRNAQRARIGVIDTAKSVIWNTQYYDTGDFEIYVRFTAKNLQLLQIGHYVTRENNRNIGIIEHVNVGYNVQDGQMITASGRFAKCILGQRLIYNFDSANNRIYPVISKGNVETAARTLVTNNIIAASDAARNIDFIVLGDLAGIAANIVDENGKTTQKQTSYGNLLTYTDELLHEYGCGAYMGFDRETLKLKYTCYEGKNRTANNAQRAAGVKPLIFSKEFDNLLTSEYSITNQELKNTALIGGEGEGTERFCVMLSDGTTGINRREIFIDASGQSRNYKDSSGTDQTYTASEYTALLKSDAKQQLYNYVVVEKFTGDVDITNSGLVIGRDFQIGDLVSVQDNALNVFLTKRIIAANEVQDDNGYTISINFEE